MTVHSPDPALADRVRAMVAAHRSDRGALLPILHDVQAEFGYVDREVVQILATELNLSRADVHGVVSFYSDFRTEPAGHTSLRLCRAEACQSVGAEQLIAHAEQVLGIKTGQTTPDGSVSLDQVFCLGNCALGPAAQINGRLHGRLDPSRLDAALGKGVRGLAPSRGAGVEPPQDMKIYVPRDSAAVSVGADLVAAAILREAGQPITVVRNGSRGMLWLEPLVEVETERGRVGYGPVTPEVVGELIAAGMLDGADHELCQGVVPELPWLRDQTRLCFARVGVTDPLSPNDYVANGGLAGLRKALDLAPADVVTEVTESGLRGRGGAGFPAGIKWKTVGETPGELKFVCCNADEGDSGTFADRMLMEGDPFGLIEGMTIAAHAVGAREGYIYIRSEYPDAVRTMRQAIDIARTQGWLGEDILGSGLSFDLFVRVGAGAYICGEETSMLESLEGKRGMVRAKPPIPAITGLFGKPTVVNNVLTLASVPAILADGAAAYSDLGVERSRGTQMFQLAGNIARGGVFETAFGITLGELINDYGGGTRSGRPVRAVQVGGPLGSYIPVSQLDLPMDYEAFAAADAMLGHGGIVVFDDTVDMAAMARFAMEFCAEESCGKCTPCRVGSVRGVETIDRIVAGQDPDGNLALLGDLCELMTDGSLCAMGGLTPNPVRSALLHFPEDFTAEGGTTNARGGTRGDQ